MILIVDFGSQYTLLIERCLFDFGVPCEIVAPENALAAAHIKRPRGIILSGGPRSVYEEGAPTVEPELFLLAVPILGICYGQQLMARVLGGRVVSRKMRGYGRDTLEILVTDKGVFSGCGMREQVWMSHGDAVVELPEKLRVLATSESAPNAAFASRDGMLVGLQFHPEVDDTPNGRKMLANFLLHSCGLDVSRDSRVSIPRIIDEIRGQVGESAHVLAGVSGGVDSSVVALLLREALGQERVWPVFIDNGLLRKGEYEEVRARFRALGFANFRVIGAADRFLRSLAGVADPERKRRIIGMKFMREFQHKARNIVASGAPVKFLAQGTIGPDRIESAATSANADRIKTHHNLVVPKNLGLAILEPLARFYKHEVRDLARELGMSEELLSRHPFPGPGLAVRIIGAVTKERLDTLREADAIFIEELSSRVNLYNAVWQAFVVLLPTVRSVGVMGDQRTYGNPVALRAVVSRDAMTADWARLPDDFLAHVANRIVNEVRGVNRVVYDITSKPPGTIEWE